VAPLPVASLAAVLGVRPHEALAASGPTLLVPVLRAGTRRFGVAVDALRDVRTLPVGGRDVSGLHGERVLGIAFGEDGTPLPVLDAEALFAGLREGGRTAAPAPSAFQPVAGPASVRREATILVVDDSITTRTLEKTILQAQGYRVLLAVDGVEALNVLRTAEREVDVVVADVEMPRLDGFGLLDAMRRDPRLKDLPTILMTSRGRPEDVARGMELGARAYLTKQQFDQGALLETIGQLLP
jgi:two-component system, chemotaxis family, sensor kinase CheA